MQMLTLDSSDVKLKLNMETLNQNKDYKKINLRDFRHGFTQLKDSISAGQIYQVEEKSKVLGYFVPAKYEFEVKRKSLNKEELEEYRNCVRRLSGAFKLKRELQKGEDYMDIYREELERKYLRK